jgi:tetratricopeptide (TPR) repeat protein
MRFIYFRLMMMLRRYSFPKVKKRIRKLYKIGHTGLVPIYQLKRVIGFYKSDRVCLLFFLIPAIASFFDVSCLAQTRRSDIEKPLALFFELKYQEAMPLFQQIVNADSKNAEALTWLAESYRRIGKHDEALANARKALLLNPRSGFAHLVIAQASYPSDDSVYAHVQEAIECDSSDPNAWLMMWGEAIKRNNPVLHDKTLKKLYETGFLTKAALAYGRAELRNLPPDAIYITNGDMDTYPAKIVQTSEGFRADVTVIEKEHLGISWACRFIRDHQKVPLPVSDAEMDLMKEITDARGIKISPSEQNFRKWIEQKRQGHFSRPITVAPTVDEYFYNFDKKHFHYCGMYLLWKPEESSGMNGTTLLRQCLSGINPDDFTGPWASSKDRSPVRRFYSKGIVRVLYRVALTYSEDLITAKRSDEAEKILKWLEAFEERTELGAVLRNEIGKLRELMK